MDTFSGGVIIVLFLVILSNWRNGTLGQWFMAKFLNKGPSTKKNGDKPAGQTSPATPVQPASTPVQRPSSSPAAAGFLVDPVPGAPITSGFGQRVGEFHQGIDYGVAIGTPVDAAGSGVVTSVGAAAGYGNRVVIDHGNGLSTLYAHLSSYAVKVGDRVTAGQVIARSGNTGNSTGPHLHFEVRTNGTPVNPLDWLVNKIKAVLA